jgi:hypothetical protein
MQFPQEKLVEEQKTIRVEIGKLHAEIWRLVRGRNSAFVDQIAQYRLDIQSKTRRVKTIDYLLAHKNEWSENCQHLPWEEWTWRAVHLTCSSVE